MSCAVDLELTSDEVARLKNAFKDPEFRKLFRDYAEEISDPANKQKYEDEIRLMELEQGIDAQFVNPIPGHCLKTRHWPEVPQFSERDVVFKEKEEPTRESVKVFINVCKSDKVECPEMKSMKGNSSVQGGSGVYWSLPHCFTPPREDIDKAKKRAMVYDVAFHPEAFELANSSIAFKRLLNSTAIEGLQKQYNLYFGKTFAQALQLFNYKKNSQAENSHSKSPSTSCTYDDDFLKAVHLLKGVPYKGIARPTVIRRRRSDYEQRQAEIRKREAEDLKSCQTTEQRQAIKKLSSYPNCGDAETSNDKEVHMRSNEINGPIKPDYTIIYSSDFDLSNCRDSNDVNPLRPPDRLKVSVKLPGLSSSTCVDLEVTKTHLHLNSEKPVAYLLDLNLPYEVNYTEGTAKFDKSVHTLFITLPVVKNEESTVSKLNDNTVNIGNNNNDNEEDSKAVQSNSTTNTSDHETVSSSNESRKRARRKHRKPKNKSNTSNGILKSTLNTSLNVQPCSDNRNILLTGNGTKFTAVPTIEKCVPQINELIEPLSNGETALESGNNLEKKEAVNLSVYCRGEVEVKQVPSSQMILSKDRRLSPVRFRQDPSSLTILLGVRGILSTSVTVNWTHPMHLDSPNTGNISHPQPTHLLLLITFSSRGSGGCTMDWGIVIRCPSSHSFNESTGNYGSVSECFKSHQCRMPPFEPSPPQIISCLISLTNGVLVIRKPICSCDSLPTNKKPSGLLADRAIWWKSVAIGRTLTAGMQECAFMGMESFLLHSDYLPISSNCRQPISNASCSVLSSLETSSGSNNLSSKPLIYDQSLHKNSSKQQKLKSLRVTSLSNECCSIEWNPNFDSAVSASDHTFEVNEKSPSILTSNEMISGYQHLRGLDRVGRINDLSATKRFRRNSTPCNSGQANGQTMVMLKGILKQRSVSESSGDETGILEANNLRGAGLAGYRDNPLSSDEFPTASSDENHELISSEQHFNFRRCISSDKLSVVETTQKDIQCNQLPVCRPRLRSVSFSQHDQRVDFSPRDTVEALHHTLCSRRKKLRRRDARHRRGSDRSSNHSDNESGKSASKLDDEINVCTRIVCESPNNTLFFSTKNEALFKGNSGNLATELCDINSTKSLHDSVFQVSSIPNITESNNDIDDESEYVHVGNPNTGLEDNDKPTTGFPVASTHTNNSLFRSGCNETNNVGDMTHYNISAVHLTSSSILELDEE